MRREFQVRFCERPGVQFPWATHLAVCFQHGDDADKFLVALKERLATFHLELHPEKTRLLRFGRFAAEDRQRRGEGKPETFDFLGFTHYCGKTRAGRFRVGRKTRRKTMIAKLAQLKELIRKRMHAPVPVTGAWLSRVLRGHYQYYGVRGNGRALFTYRDQMTRLWRQALR